MERVARAYNESIFDIRQHFKTVFPEEKFCDHSLNIGKKCKADKSNIHSTGLSQIYKIKYTINLLPIIGLYVKEVDGKNEIVN